MISASSGSGAIAMFIGKLITILCMRSDRSTNWRSGAICESYLYLHDDMLADPKRIESERRTENGGKSHVPFVAKLGISKIATHLVDNT